MSYSIGRRGGVTGPNASLTCGIDWERSLKNFVVVKKGQKLVALVPALEGYGTEIAQIIAEALNEAAKDNPNL